MKKNYKVKMVNIITRENKMNMLILSPVTEEKNNGKLPGILWIHGGGYITGMKEMIYMSRAIGILKKYAAVIVTPEYRLAGKAPYPAALEDCYAALEYMYNNADELGIDRNLLIVGGESAGGGLTAALCMYVRDNSEIKIAFQMPLYPMIDDRDTDSSANNYRLPWNTLFNHIAWKKYLFDLKEERPVYAVPARQTDYSDLPPCYTFVGDKEPFYCETLSYVENLKKAGVYADVDVYHTGFHAFDMLLPFRKISKRAIKKFEEQYLKMLTSALK